MPFGRILKSNAARALRRAGLSEQQVFRLRRRIVDMLLHGNTPREYREYAKLLRKIGLEERWAELESANQSNPHVKRWCEYFTRHAGSEPTP